MNLEEFMVLYGHFSQKKKVQVICGCGKENTINRERAIENINKHDEYTCRSCVQRLSHATNPRSEETHRKQSEAKKGKKLSEDTKAKISAAKKAYWQSEEGEITKKKLSRLTAHQHSFGKPDKSKRKVLYVSAKNGGEIRVCNSSYEFIACEYFLEKDVNVLNYETQVPYSINGRYRSLDFLVTYVTGNKKVIEIKPQKRLKEEAYVIQLEDSRKNAEVNGYEFEIWTEQNLNITKCEEATRLADEYRQTHYFIDYGSFRIQKNKEKSKRHYDNKIGKEKVIVFCNHCKTYHSRLKITYERNVSKNGRFICIYENGVSIGRRSKKHLHNPLADLGLKKCSRCDRVLSVVDCFSTNGQGKISSRCKECRAEVSKKRYNNG